MARCGIRFRWARGWSRACCWCLRTLRHAVPRHGVNGGGWAVVLADACTTLWQRVCVEHRMLLHGLGPVRRRPVSSRACWPTHRFGVLLGSREKRRGRPARVRRPAVGSPKKLARGNWHASIEGRAVTGARTKGDVGGCLETRGARKWRLEGVEGGEIVRENVGIRVLGWERKTVFVRAREVDRRSKSEDTGTEDRASGTRKRGAWPVPPAARGRSVEEKAPVGSKPPTGGTRIRNGPCHPPGPCLCARGRLVRGA